MSTSKRLKTIDRLERVQDEDAREWEGFRRPARIRLAWACEFLLETGSLNRRDIMKAHEVSEAQASMDLREIVARAPWLMEYDKFEKCYRPKAAKAKTP